ncbi:MAG: hypothetical protein IPF92_23295 [Myxococcales bacterium]|jgi:hypothetical protein|nr:hypothetical protein [Myxococcales bacterium]MBL0194766.1 hypothetical protein [Myxococcales bacterium]HQY62353.1 hypothetical protein [Polyangiaceae bacterium]
MTRARPATTYEELAFLALSHVPVPRSADPIARAAQLLPTARASLVAAGHVFREDRAALGALAASGVLACQALPRLFRDLAQLRATGARGLADLAAGDVARPEVLRALRARDARLAELLFCGMQLAAPLVATALADRDRAEADLDALQSALSALATWAPGLRSAGTIVLTRALGASGRAYRDGASSDALDIYVGGELPADRAALLALHELLVVRAAAAHGPAERAALDAATELVRGSPFAAAQSARLEGLNLRELPSSREVRQITSALVARLGR